MDNAESQGMLLVQGLPDIELMHAHQRRGFFRATIPIAEGRYSAVGMVQSGTPRSQVRSASLDLCQLSETVCEYVDLLGIVNKVSGGARELHAAYLLLDVQNGHRQSVAGAIRTIAEEASRAGVYVAAAHAFGLPTFNMVVEVMTNDVEEFHRLALMTTDFEGLRVEDHLLLDTSNECGMGT